MTFLSWPIHIYGGCPGSLPTNREHGISWIYISGELQWNVRRRCQILKDNVSETCMLTLSWIMISNDVVWSASWLLCCSLSHISECRRFSAGTAWHCGSIKACTDRPLSVYVRLTSMQKRYVYTVATLCLAEMWLIPKTRQAPDFACT
jgi:hypothetical protein